MFRKNNSWGFVLSTIEIRNLGKKFGYFVALSDITLDVAEGEFVTLLGPSGCGKTTLLKMISGFIEPTSGTIMIGGVDVTRVPPELRDTAMCFQSYALFPHLSVRENLLFGLKQKRLSKVECSQRLESVSETLELTQQLDKLPNQLSGGQQQRVSLGRALAMRPGVILFDEPLSNLDAKLRQSVRTEIRRIQQHFNLTAIYVTHDQLEALAMSDRIFVMNAGRVVQCAKPQDIYTKPNSSFIADFIGSANIFDAEVVSELSDGRWVLNSCFGQLVVKSEEEPRGKKIRACWRPEKVKLDGEGENKFQVQVHHTPYQGGFTDVFFTLDDQEFRAQITDLPSDSNGSMELSLQPEDIILLEELQ